MVENFNSLLSIIYGWFRCDPWCLRQFSDIITDVAAYRIHLKLIDMKQYLQNRNRKDSTNAL